MLSMQDGSYHRFLPKIVSFVSILITITYSFFPSCHAVGINLEGKTVFDGIPSGVIRDLTISEDVVYIAAENGVFELIGNRARKLNYNTFNDRTGIISDLKIDGDDLWIVEYGVGVFKYNLKKRVAEQAFLGRKWSNFAWTIGLSPTHLFVSTVSNVFVISRKNLTDEFSINEKLSSFKLSDVYSINTTNKKALVASLEGYVEIFFDSLLLREHKISKLYPKLNDATYVNEIDGTLYLGGSNGLYIVNDASKFLKIEKSEHAYIQDVYKSSDGEIWVSDGSLRKLEGDKLVVPRFMNPILASDSISSITKISRGPQDTMLLASSQLGLITLSSNNHATNFVSLNEEPLRTHITKSINIANESLVETKNKLFKIDMDSASLTPWEHSEVINNCLSDREKLAGKLLLRYGKNFCSSKSTHLVIKDETTFFAYLDDGTEANFYLIENNTMSDKLAAPKELTDTILLSNGGLAAYDVYDNVHFQLTKNTWRTIHASDAKWFGIQCLLEINIEYLVCTSGSGLKAIDKKTGGISKSKIFQNNEVRFIRGVHLSGDTHLWVASNMGLFVKDIDSGTLRRVDSSFGIYDSDFEYKSFIKVGTRLLIKGDKYSYLINEELFFEKIFNKRKVAPKTILNEMKWRDSSGIHKKPLPRLTNFTFSNDFEELTLEFISNEFLDSAHSMLEFKIDGEEQWHPHNNDFITISLSDLAHGPHSVEVRAVVGNVAGQTNRVSFSIAPPFWLAREGFLFYLFIVFTFLIGWRFKIGIWLFSQFQSTALYRNITRYEITDGQSKFEKMLRSKERYISNIAHELRTPMQVIKGCLEKLSDDKNQSSKEFISITNNMMRVEKLLKQLRDETPQAIEAADYYKLYTVGDIKFIVNALEPLARQKRQTIDFKVNGKKRISLISDSLEKILSNLISNAVKYTPERGNIRVVCSLDSKILKIVVQDDGDGIDKELQEKIFERFTRGNTLQDGDGIGLATVRNLVELNQGNISLESKKGVGSKFTIILPVDDIDFVNSRATKMPLSPFDSREKTILIVDGNREFRTYLFDLLSENFRCLVAKNGRQALEVLQHYLVDLVLTDQFMQEMDGISLAHSMRNSQRLSAIPILMLAATTGNELEKRALEAKIDYFISKPAASEEIIMRIEHLIFMRGKSLKEEGEQTTIFEYGCLSIPEFLNEKDVAFYLNFLAVLEKNYQDETFNREQAASQLMMSARSLNRRMSELFDYNFNEFLSRFRIEKSIPLLMKGSTTLDAGLDVGYGTGAYFSTSFKKFMGLPPKKFIEQYKAPEHSS